MSEAMLDTTSGAIIMGKPIARRYTDCKYIMLDTTEGGIIIDGESAHGDRMGHNVKKKASRPFFFHFFFYLSFLLNEKVGERRNGGVGMEFGYGAIFLEVQDLYLV